MKITQSLWMSKLRYGLQLCNQVRTKQDDPTNTNMKNAQTAQNKMLRMLDRVTLKDHVTTESLLLKYNLPSVNQLAAEVKMTETWKSINIHNYPFKLELNHPGRNDGGRSIRVTSIKEWKDTCKTKAASLSMSRDCAKLWNQAPAEITNAPTLFSAKRLIKAYCRTLEL